MEEVLSAGFCVLTEWALSSAEACWVAGLRGGGIEGRAGEEDGVHRDPLNKPRVP